MKAVCCLHSHSTCSDGELSPDELLVYLKDCGYNVISITDHMNLTLPWKVPDDILFLPGVEWYSPRGYEIVCIEPVANPERSTLDLSQTKLKWLAHPVYSFFGNYGKSMTVNMLAVLMNNNLDGYELYNGSDRQLTGTEEMELHSFNKIFKINRYAVDDFHVKGQEFRAWIEMDVPDLEYSVIMDKLLSGDYEIRTENNNV